VEAALTLPLTVFLILGTLQLFMMLQGRIMAEYAAFASVRAGSRHQGDCVPMMHAALAGLLPNIVSFAAGGGVPNKMAQAWSRRIGSPNNPRPKFVPKQDGEFNNGTIFWLVREQPLAGSVPSPEDVDFDAPVQGGGGMRLEVRLIYWFPLKIPFADWVMSRMFLAYFGLQDYNAMNPLMPAEKQAGWTRSNSAPSLDSQIRSEFMSRVSNREYVFPIQATYGMRMMTPARSEFFQQQNCGADTPQSL
jgi:hypothetical protein